jgi:hypothetical protein
MTYIAIQPDVVWIQHLFEVYWMRYVHSFLPELRLAVQSKKDNLEKATKERHLKNVLLHTTTRRYKHIKLKIYQ